MVSSEKTFVKAKFFSYENYFYYVTIHGLEAAHNNNSGRYLKFCSAKTAPHS